MPQNEETIDFLRNGVSSGVDLVVGGANDFWFLINKDSFTGYYVNRDSSCGPEFQGGLPPIADSVDSVGEVVGSGDPVVASDPGRSAFFMADLRLDDPLSPTSTGIGVFRSTSSVLRNTCAGGTHSTAQANACWPTRRLVLGRPTTGQLAPPDLVDKPHLAVDERTSGTGSGQVYVVATDFNPAGTSSIMLVACTNTLSSCSSPQTISGPDTDVQFPHVAVRSNGGISVTWTNVIEVGPGVFNIQIKYRPCSKATVPAGPTCGTTTTLQTEAKPLLQGGALSTQDFPVATYPKHDHRREGTNIETYVVWERCKIPPIGGFLCPDADIVMKESSDNGATWSSIINVATGREDQFFPWIRTDRSRQIVNIVHYSSGPEATFQHRVRVELRHVNPGGTTAPDPITDSHTLTTLLNEPNADLLLRGQFFGDYIGVAARGTGSNGSSRAYASFTYNNLQGNYDGVLMPNQNNHIARLDY